MMRPNLIAVLLAATLPTAGCITHHRAEVVHTAPRTPHVEGPYQKPLVSPGAQFGALPPTVQNTIRAQVGGAQIDRVFKDRTSVGPVYKIYFQHAGVYPPLYVTAEGDVLNPDYTIAVPAVKASQEAFAIVGTGEGGTIRLVDLPEEVLKIVAEQAPHGEISGIEKQTWGDRSVYVIGFKGDNASPRLYVRSDGIVLKEVVK
jgi:hypothetical protein